MVRPMVRLMVRSMLAGVCLGIVWAAVATAAEPLAKPQEKDFYAIDAVEIPAEAYLEVGALEWIPDGRLAVASRRGEIWITSDPAAVKPRWQRFAHGCMRCSASPGGTAGST